VGFTLPEFKKFFWNAYCRLEEMGLFQEWFGHWCVDAGEVEGKAGAEVDLFMPRTPGLRTVI
jgi:hypothetical protein